MQQNSRLGINCLKMTWDWMAPVVTEIKAAGCCKLAKTTIQIWDSVPSFSQLAVCSDCGATLTEQQGSMVWGVVMSFISAHADHSVCHWSLATAFKLLLIFVHVKKKCSCSSLCQDNMCVGKIFFICVVMEALLSCQGSQIIKWIRALYSACILSPCLLQKSRLSTQ